MSIFKALKKGLAQGKGITVSEVLRYKDLLNSVRLVEPNKGQIVTVKILAEGTKLEVYIMQIKELASKVNAEVTETGNKVTIRFQDLNIAETVRDVIRSDK